MKKVKRIVILGGGSAGWMAASLFNKKWKEKGIEIVVVDSSDIGIIGVGEGSTPLLKTFFDYLGIAEEEWMPACNATYKAGIRFVNWSTRPGYESYFHPFDTCLDHRTLPAFKHVTSLRRQQANIKAHPDRYFLTTKLAEKKLAPKPDTSFPFTIGHGYHFDAALLGQFLKERAVAKGVVHIDKKIVDASIDANNDITALQTECGEEIEGDFFIDCSGFAGVLIQKKLGVGFIEFGENLFNDSAIAIPTEIEGEIPSETVSTALKYGWAWKIPLANRYGNGYVYSSKYCSQEDAEKEFLEHLNVKKEDVQIRHLKMNVGRLEQNWKNNCVAIGLSQGFVEPLEATALHFIQIAIQKFMNKFEEGEFTDKFKNDYNEEIAFDYERIRDYIVLHYKANTRHDTEYWLDNQRNTNLSSYLEKMIDAWVSNKDLEEELKKLEIDRYYQAISWYSLFAGMGLYPDGATKGFRLMFNINQIDSFLENCSLNFKSHKEYLESLGNKGKS